MVSGIPLSTKALDGLSTLADRVGVSLAAELILS